MRSLQRRSSFFGLVLLAACGSRQVWWADRNGGAVYGQATTAPVADDRSIEALERRARELQAQAYSADPLLALADEGQKRSVRQYDEQVAIRGALYDRMADPANLQYYVELRRTARDALRASMCGDPKLAPILRDYFESDPARLAAAIDEVRGAGPVPEKLSGVDAQWEFYSRYLGGREKSLAESLDTLVGKAVLGEALGGRIASEARHTEQSAVFTSYVRRHAPRELLAVRLKLNNARSAAGRPTSPQAKPSAPRPVNGIDS